jgi:hypothetical protein
MTVYSANDNYKMVLKTRLRAFASVPPRAFKCKTAEYAELTQRNAKEVVPLEDLSGI